MKGIPQCVFPHCFFFLSFSSFLPGLEPSQNPLCLASGPNEAQDLMSHCKNSVRDTKIGKRCICSYSERSTLHRVWAITEESAVALECGLSIFCQLGEFICWVGGSPQPLGNHPLLCLLTVPWNCPASSGCVIYLADWGSRFIWIWLVIMDPFDFNQVYVYALGTTRK